MHNYYNETLQRNVRILYIGEYTATADNVYLSTVLGSCITVVLYDSTRNIGGMNHFMLPESGNNRDHNSGILGGAARYGMGAMEFLINELMKLGARREELSAKVFGGGHVLHTVPTQAQSVPEKNIDFAFTYLRTEGIPVTASDVRGTVARKIFFDPQSNEVLLKRITGETITAIEGKEQEYLRSLEQQSTHKTSERLF